MTTQNVLICEDESLVAKDIEHTLRSCGYGVVGAVTTGEEAITIAGQKRPDLVLMDIYLAGEMNGIETAIILGKDYNIPVIYLTAFADGETLQKAKASCPFGYIVKPFQENDLRTAIEIGMQRHYRENAIMEALSETKILLSGDSEDAAAQTDTITKPLKSFQRLNLCQELITKLTDRVLGDFNIVGECLRAIKDTVEEESEVNESVRTAIESYSKIRKILHRLEHFSGTASYELKNQNINQVVMRVLEEADLSIRRDVSIHSNCHDKNYLVKIDDTAIQEVLADLLSNSHKAMPFGGLVTVRLSLQFEGYPEKYNRDLVPGWYVTVKITDGGVGIQELVLQRAFEPFVNYEKGQVSDGLGLAVAHGVMKAHGGGIALESHKGVGTSVILYFPAVE